MVELLDLVDIDVLEKLQKTFTELLGFHVAFAGLDCKTIGGRDTDQRSVCAMLVKEPEGYLQCYNSDKEAGDLAIQLKTPVLLYRCQCFFSNFVIPIKVTNEVIGFLYGGQFFVRLPGERSSLEWDMIIKCEGIPKENQERFKEQFKINEEEEWIKLKDGVKAQYATKDGIYIKNNFFLKNDGRPNDEDLNKIAKACGLINANIFINSYISQLTPDNKFNRLKNQKDIFHAIELLTAIANAFSEECNTKYALRTYFETIQELKKYPNLEKETGSDYQMLSNDIFQLLDDLKLVNPQIEQVGLIDTIDVTSGKILSVLVEYEEKQLHLDIWKNKYIYWTIPSLKPKSEKFLHKIIEKRKIQGTESEISSNKNPTISPRSKKEATMRKLKELREERNKIASERSLQGPGSYFLFVLGVIVAVVLFVIPYINKGTLRCDNMQCKFEKDFKNGIAGWYFEEKEITESYRNSNILMLDVEFGTQCRLNCKYCFRINDNRDHLHDHLQELNAEDIKDIVCQAKDLGAKSIHFVGKGESLENKDFLDIIRYIAKNGMIPLIFTAGHVLGDDKLALDIHGMTGDAIVKDLYKSGASVILKINSLSRQIQNEVIDTKVMKYKDGVDKEYNYTRVRNIALERLMNAGFNNSIHNPTRLGTATVILKNNYEELLHHYRYFRCLNIYPIINTVVPCGRTYNMDEVELLSPSAEEKFELWKSIYSFNVENGIKYEGISSYIGGHICSQLGYAMYINVFGEVFDCPSSGNELGNVKSNGRNGKKLSELWEMSPCRKRYHNCFDNGCPWRFGHEGKMIPVGLFKKVNNYLKKNYPNNPDVQNFIPPTCNIGYI